MLFHEAITAAKRNIKLQIFASDADADAVATAREGVYPEMIEKEVSSERLARFFSKEEHGYKVLPELRAGVVFAAQDVLVDPPFSHLDLISCRNVLIYLSPTAQAKIVSLFHFALNKGGLLLLGSSERVGNNIEDRFEAISKPESLYRRIGHSQLGEFAFSTGVGLRIPPRSSYGKESSSQAVVADLCQQVALKNHAPASVLINHKLKSLYSIGPIGLYLSLPSGHSTHDLLAMAPQGLRNKLRSAIQEAGQKNERVIVAGGRRNHEDYVISFNIDVQPIHNDGEEFFLVSFVDNPAREQKEKLSAKPQDGSRIAELEKELEATQTELQDAIHNLEISNKEQVAINEEAMSVNEEFQSTNEELLTSKEELQSLNEELTALNLTASYSLTS
jgi:two-component system CheB/CheR fusion protein